ncbi:cytosolic carboxypeptidase 4 isoform X1 [Dunckerocampus dactyliophorus]|uniref:cytosolic carboxypeptidase 4 isoform X1 n=2 Tax=Dunckerocampus dactyliophorus TaxID=161453 RepID=UPI002405B038|nr:cytosolic carboxypeptidase 4 isoform X1 [Dunckerocampus dactyliophorus]XP_054632710.1 cytosolic carboxypeptidase 4 isoform X1 [Dunckerocampus dactyliophorus]XP_054632711.1 cytosolic carboxypeptidase 4 isoform X1 [Dunckerocampus dactyliophorus]XP_054632712.1 cytosolic carboxypeptidase 4 isoform X1 [Dunckerocampus dactyliophorus]
MAASPTSSSGFEVLFSDLQNATDVESTLNVLNILDELLSAGTDHRIDYMIRKGGSEALLNALVTNGCGLSPNYRILLPILYLLAKVGHKDCCVGKKAEEAGAVLLTLNLLKNNIQHARRAAACLLVIRVFASSVSTANLIVSNQGQDVIYKLMPRYTTKNLQTIKASINAFAALLCSNANICSAVAKGYMASLLQLYEDWHSKDTTHSAMEIRHALLRCLHKITHSALGRRTFVSQGGLRLLYHTTQTCLLNKCLESLVEPSVQLMRKCLPKTPLPLTSDQSAYSFPLPGRQCAVCDVAAATDGSSGEIEEEEQEEEGCQEAASIDYDDDLETDLNKLCLCPDPDRPKELLPQYSRLCPELLHDFQELDSSSERSSPSSSSSSDDDTVLYKNVAFHFFGAERRQSAEVLSKTEKGTPSQTKSAAAILKAKDFNSHNGILSTSSEVGGKVREMRGEAKSGPTNDDQDNKEGNNNFYNCAMIDKLIERHGVSIPYHKPTMYRAAAIKTKSIPGFNILAFPDFWGHIPPTGNETMAPRKPSVQRQKVFEDIQRFLNTDDMVNQIVFDLEDDSSPDRPDSLRFFSRFECGNLRKAVQVRRYEYDLILNADANCCKHTQWFYFEVSNMVPDVPYRFNVINCEKSNSQFNYGMQPVLYSVRDALNGQPHWLRSGTEICYFRNHFCPARGSQKTTFYTLTFTITFKYNEDVCYLAYHYPYTYSALRTHLNLLHRSIDPAKVFFRQQILCATLAGNACPIVTITACPPSKGYKDIHQLRNRPFIVLTSRVHPGESNASWVMKGTLEFLCSSDPVATALREAFVFKIIPILNPDGVINGMNRCDLNREDLNRQWCKPDPVLCPTIYHTKGFLYYLNSIGRTPRVFCDYHGHSRKKNVFLYGCSVKETLWQSGSAVDTAGLKEDPGYRTIAKALDRIAPAFSFNSCNYMVEKSRSSTARVVVWREMGVLRSYTMESTYNGFDQGIYKGLQTGIGELQEMGMKFCHSLLSVTEDTRVLYGKELINHVNLDHNILDHKSHNCFEDDEPPCAEDIEYSTECPGLKGSDMESDINRCMAGTDEEEGVAAIHSS